MRKSMMNILIVGLMMFFSNPLFADIPDQLRYQGVLTNNAGVPLNGNFNLTFRIYNVQIGGTPLWSETQSNVAVDKGLFGVSLGSVMPLTLAFDQPYWISIEVGNDGEMTPRQKLESVPYAKRASVSEGISSDALVPLYITGDNIGVGTASPTTKLDVRLPGTDTGPVMTLGNINNGPFGLIGTRTGDNALTIKGHSGDPLSFAANEADDHLYITAAGLVGIGTTTPSAKLDVAGTTQMQGFKMPTNAGTGLVLTSDAAGIGTWQTISGTGSGGWTDDGAAVRLTTLSDNVGIGTSTPATKLDVVGSINVSGGSIQLSNDGGGRFDLSHWSGLTRLQAFPANGGGGEIAIQREVPGAVVSNTGIYDGSNQRIAWFDGATRNVGIGTDAPQYKLDVEGYVQATGYYTGDIIFQKDKKPLWRMYEDENGLYLENLSTHKRFRLVMEPVKN